MQRRNQVPSVQCMNEYCGGDSSLTARVEQLTKGHSRDQIRNSPPPSNWIEALEGDDNTTFTPGPMSRAALCGTSDRAGFTVITDSEEVDRIPATPMSTTCDQRTRFHVQFKLIGTEFVVTYEQVVHILFSERRTREISRNRWDEVDSLYGEGVSKTCTSLCLSFNAPRNDSQLDRYEILAAIGLTAPEETEGEAEKIYSRKPGVRVVPAAGKLVAMQAACFSNTSHVLHHDIVANDW
ncbi:hypothetical protein BJY52DRAFT_1353103 [Lactarius psammicola]|nr:hypothetical protein BJY52DRAFT_1353103 [Lactarius psammicola]